MSPTATPVTGREESSTPSSAEPNDNQVYDEHEADHTADLIEKAAQARIKHIWRLCFTIFALVQAGNVVLQPPLVQLKELSSCMSYYGPGWTLGRDCRVEYVQNELETLIKWQQLLDTAPGILFGVFYGMAADRFGRRPVLGLALMGLTLAAVWTQVVCMYKSLVIGVRSLTDGSSVLADGFSTSIDLVVSGLPTSRRRHSCRECHDICNGI